MSDHDPIGMLVDAARRARAAGLVVATSGNVSVRLDASSFAITGSGSDLGEVVRDDIAVCPPSAGNEGEARPSLEWRLHGAVYETRSDVGAVLHFQSPYATAFACSVRPEVDLDFIPEIPAYVGTVEQVPYHDPGTEDLARAVAERSQDPLCGMLVLRNHGQVALGTDLATVLRNAEVFEFACRVAAVGLELRRFDRATVERLRGYGS